MLCDFIKKIVRFEMRVFQKIEKWFGLEESKAVRFLVKMSAVQGLGSVHRLKCVEKSTSDISDSNTVEGHNIELNYFKRLMA